MALATLTCSEVLSNAEKNRRHVLATASGKTLEKELKAADDEVERARNRENCI